MVNDLHLLGSSVGPHEADPPLVIDPDAVLSDPIAFQRFEPVSRWNPEIVQRYGGSDLTQLAQRRRVDPRIDRRHPFATPQSFGVPAAERSDHESNDITLGVNNARR